MDKARPFAAPFRRSGLSVAVIAADLAALQAFVEKAGLTRSLPERHRWLEDSMAFEFDNAAASARAVTLPIDEAVYDAEARGRLSYVFTVLGGLRHLTRDDLAAATGLTVDRKSTRLNSSH